jgi:hypothetical protein
MGYLRNDQIVILVKTMRNDEKVSKTIRNDQIVILVKTMTNDEKSKQNH